MSTSWRPGTRSVVFALALVLVTSAWVALHYSPDAEAGRPDHAGANGRGPGKVTPGGPWSQPDASPTATATATPDATSTPGPAPTETATPEPTATATPDPTATATPDPTATATPDPTVTPTPEPTATATPAPDPAPPSGFSLGVNLPWYSWGCDFGCGENGGASSAETQAALRERLALLPQARATTVRWWVFPGDPWQLAEGGGAVSIEPAVFDDMDAALALADEYGLDLVLTLFSNPAALPGDWLEDDAARAAVVDALGALFERYGNHPRIDTWEVFNEPEWDIWNGAVETAPVQRFVADVAAEVHARTSARVTVGSAMLDGLPLWADAGLDYYSPHWYDYMEGGDWCAPCTTADEVRQRYGIEGPIVIGEYYTDEGERAVERLQAWIDAGYDGAWGWSLFPERTNDGMDVDLGAFEEVMAGG